MLAEDVIIIKRAIENIGVDCNDDVESVRNLNDATDSLTALL